MDQLWTFFPRGRFFRNPRTLPGYGPERDFITNIIIKTIKYIYVKFIVEVKAFRELVVSFIVERRVLLYKQRLIFKTDLFKILIEILVFSHVLYCLPVWGPSLTNANVNRLKCLQHRAIRLYLGLRKYDHISHHFHTLHWLSIGSMIQYRTLCAMRHQYFQPKHIPLVPPISFGRQHQHATRTTQLFAQPLRCRLSFTQKHFRSQAAHWWNAVPNDMLTSPTFQDNLFSYLCKIC